MEITTRLLASMLVLAATAHAQPPTVQPSDLTVLVEKVGAMPYVIGPGFFGPTPNLGSPVVVDEMLYLIDQNDGIFRADDDDNEDDKKPKRIFSVSQAPDGLSLTNRQAILNISPGTQEDTMYVMFTSGSEPTTDIPIYRLPAPLPGYIYETMIPVPDLYRLDAYLGNQTEYQVLYAYTIEDGTLTEPRAIACLETQSGAAHNGGGMLTLGDGRIVFATGDALPLGADGRRAAQDPNEIPGKILIIDPDDGAITVAAIGVRNVQHMEYVAGEDGDEPLIGFADIGGVTAEEINYVSLAALLDTTHIENFGWGRNADGMAREGTFYVGPGIPVTTTEPAMVGTAPVPEPGFIQPQAQYGRHDLNALGGVAVSGPVTSVESFEAIKAAWSDLASGRLYATTSKLTATNAPVVAVNLIDESGRPYARFQDMRDQDRVDPRLFRFPDGSAGVLFEATGEYFRLTEVD